jgi:Golgi phosphoprotein 3 (GPP34)
MLIAETFALIALETATGEVREPLKQLHQQRFLAAALLMELAVQTRVGIHLGRVVVLDQLPSRHPLLTASLRSLISVSGQLNASQAIVHIEKDLRGLLDDVLEGLVRRDWLHPARRRYRFFGKKLFAVRSTQAQGEALDGLKHAVKGEDNSLRALAMLALAAASGVLDQLFLPEEAQEARTRLLQLREEIGEQLAIETVLDDQLLAIAMLAELAPALLQDDR